MNIINRKVIYSLVILFVSFFIGYYVSDEGIYKFELEDNNKNVDNKTEKEERSKNNAEIIFVYIGSSRCPYSNSNDLYSDTKEVRSIVRERTQEIEYDFLSIGVSLDSNPQKGLKHLKRSGSYDEVVSGNGWKNIGVLRYIWETIPGEASIPQILIYERMLSTDGVVKVKDERILARLAGYSEIKKFLDNGVDMRTPKLRQKYDNDTTAIEWDSGAGALSN